MAELIQQYQAGAITPRELVEGVWKYMKSWVRNLDSYGTDQFNIVIFLTANDAQWCKNPFQHFQVDVSKESEGWFAAAEVTLERLEEIRHAMECVGMVSDVQGSKLHELQVMRCNCHDCIVEIVRELCSVSYTLSRERAHLAELSKGIRPEVLV